ncbi:MAG: hypothetical protein JWN40_991 [Phycisphaerales bacterium]|nr:hypothetical protein [Phycisphaerales bacterium]
MMSASNPTDLEQYAIELINRARANPLAEAARFGVDLNEGLAPGTISAAPAQPLALNPYLVSSARTQSGWMIDTDTFSHTGAGGSDPGARMQAAGYRFDTPWSWAENIALRSQKTTTAHADVIDAIERDLFVDVAIADRGHRVNLLAPQNNEVGVGVVTGLYTSFQAAMLTQDFASSGDHTFLTGVVYTDAVKKDQFYTPGEGLGAVTITATRIADGATFTTQSYTAGGYSLDLAPGQYKVTASGGKLAKPITYNDVTITQENIKQDFIATATTSAPTPIPTPPKTTRDTRAPHAALQAMRKRESSRYYRFSVLYTDNVNLSTASLGAGDLLVQGAGGYSRVANFVSVDSRANGKTRTATYEVKGPHGQWDRAHNGVYTVWIASNQVKDASGNYLPAQQLGSFTVRIGAAPAAINTVHHTTTRNPVLD